ncbi:deoxycytidylate deaminase [Sphingomonas melonis]|uniref:deoxycytidylate deaminase n=1 Tax=Sphingomonas melonis TaxID=152682 RepID=UPI0035C855B3
MSWAKRWMDQAAFKAGWSKDPRRGVGAVIVNDRQVDISSGWNGLPRGVDDEPIRYSPEHKAKWCEHAERNAIYNAAAEGHATRGCTLYSTYFPCADCARGIIQCGITRIVTVEPDWHYEPRAVDWAIALQMFTEANVAIDFVSADTHFLLAPHVCA